MYGDNKQIRAVADIAAQIMAGTHQPVSEELKGDQHKIDKNKNGKVDAHDFKLLRKEDTVEEGIGDTLKAGAKKILAKVGGGSDEDQRKDLQRKMGVPQTGKVPTQKNEEVKDEYARKVDKYLKKKYNKEEVEVETELEEGWDDMVKAAKDSVKSGPKPSGGAGVKQGSRYGGSKQKDEPEDDEKPKKKKMSEMVAAYKDGGFKALEESFIKEEPSSEEFAKELEDQKAKFDGKKKGGDVAKPSVQAVKNEEVEPEIQVINADLANGVDQVNIEERALTAAETEKKEDTVKSMKKNLSGFKERYGKDAKSVMYATATKQAKGE